MYTLYKRFINSVVWNAVESIVYHAVLLAHQIALFKTITPANYGLIGSIFAIIYLVITLMNLGLDASLAPFFTRFSTNRQAFYQFAITQILINYILYACILCGVFITQYFFAPSLFINVDTLSLTLIAAIIATESIKRTAKVLLQLAFKFKYTVFGEIGTITMFVCLVWGGFIYGFELNSTLIFSSMLIVSIIETVLFCLFLYRWYQALPTHKIPTQQKIGWQIGKTRIFNYCNQISKLIISGNLLVPFFAASFGLESAGILKLASNITHSITTVLEKIFGTSSSVILAQARNMDLGAKQKLFLFMTNRSNQILLCCLVFCLVNYHSLLDTSATSLLPILYLYFLIHFCDTFFIIYETFYVTEERANYLLLFNMISLAWFVLIFNYAHSPVQTLVCILLTRILFYTLISITSFVIWKIRPSLYLRPRYILGSLAISFIFFFITS